ncbi:MAG: trypsin-like peptidase domain-containing protein [Planctomycetaceae bacterium]|nr:trypsin-like peptidase domain-containing protein [Planctomycetaceae bacterium]
MSHQSRTIVFLKKTSTFLLFFFSTIGAFSLPIQNVIAEEISILEFTSKSCPYCQKAEPAVQQLLSQGVPIKKIDADTEQQLTQQFHVKELPTFILLVDQQEVERVVGSGEPIIMQTRLTQLYDTGCEYSKKLHPSQVRPHALSPSPSPQTTENTSFEKNAQNAQIFSIQNNNSSSPDSAQTPWLAATVRLCVETPNGHDWGTGTIVDARNGEALILTCGHIFRETQGKGAIEVHFFNNGGVKKVPGTFLYYDDHTDLGLVKIAPPFEVSVIPIAPKIISLREGDLLWSTGCDHGDVPTIRKHHVRSLTRFASVTTPSFHYIQVDNAPVQGRSGGGLFTPDGYLIGVCNAGEQTSDDGLFSPLSAIQNELDKANLSVVYQFPSGVKRNIPVTEIASSQPMAPATPEVAIQNPIVQASFVAPDVSVTSPQVFASQIFASVPGTKPASQAVSESDGNMQPQQLRPRFTETGLTDSEKVMLEKIQRCQEDGDEVILIIRSKRDPNRPSEVVQLSSSSPQMVRSLLNASPKNQVR